jgi:hypothetical protein
VTNPTGRWSSSSTKTTVRLPPGDEETGVASFGDIKSEALRMLAEALELREGDGEPVDDDGLRETGLDPQESGDEDLPDCMQ